MSKYSKEDILRIVEEEDVEFIRLQFTDIFGSLKNVAITTSQLEKALNNRIMFDGSSIEGFVRIEESDMYLHPDLDTLAIFPWRPQRGKVARLICDLYYPGGEPFDGDCRQVLKRVLKEAADQGYKMLIGPECEFFLFHLDDNGLPTTVTHENAGYFDVAPLDLGENARRDIVLTLEEMGYVVEASHHEAAPAQHEIDLHYGEALKTADTIMTFKLAARIIAKRHGLHATFMPKPKSGMPGSGMHINISLCKNGINTFYDENDKNGLSQEAYYFMGGLMKHMRGMSAITNPLVNSYKRLLSGYEAPDYVAWSSKNRSVSLRIPARTGFNTRVEMRNPDSASNPYLTLALCMAAGMDGIKNKILPPDSVDENIALMSEEEKKDRGVEALPRCLAEALEAFKEDTFVQEVLGEHISKKIIEAKEKEWEEYSMQVSEWETNQYLAKI